MAPPPPKPPVICYDMQINPNKRKSCLRQSTSTNVQSTKPETVTKYLAEEARMRYTNIAKDQNMLLKRERQLKQAKIDLQIQLEKMCRELQAIRLSCIEFQGTCGLSHNAAKYVNKQDEEFCKLKQKLQEYSKVRSHETDKKLKVMKKTLKQRILDEKEADNARERFLLDLDKDESYKDKPKTSRHPRCSKLRKSLTDGSISSDNSSEVSSTVQFSSSLSSENSSKSGYQKSFSPRVRFSEPHINDQKIHSPRLSATLFEELFTFID